MKRNLSIAISISLALLALLAGALTASAGGVSFGPKTDYGSTAPASYSYNLHDVVTADFDRDGKLDLAAVNAGGGYSPAGLDETGTNFASYPGSLTLLTGDGLGGFTRTFTLTVGLQAPLALVTADFNQDGKLDVSLAMSNTRSVDTFLGDGLGGFTFAYSVTTGAGTRPRDLAVGDFNKDGRPDIVVAADKQNYVSILLATPISFSVTALDLATLANPVFLNMFNPLSVAVADFNQDGSDDFVVVPDQGSMPVIKGNGNGTFAYLTQVSPGSNPRGVAVADVNADGYLDIVLGTTANVPGAYFLGQAGGIHPSQHTYGTNTMPAAVALADINGDSFPDIVNVSSKVDILLGAGDGTFGTASGFTTGNGPLALAVGDFNRDGKPDVASANRSAGTLSVLLNTTTWKSLADFYPAVNYDTGAAFSFALSQGDFTGDGKPDLAAGQLTGTTLRLFAGSANGALAVSQTVAAVGQVAGSAAGDFNRDGRLDLALARQDGNVLILTNTVASGLTAGPLYVVGASRLGRIAAGDLNGDGALDLVAPMPGNDTENKIGVLLNKGTGVFSATVIYTVEMAPRYAALADFDADGKLDVAVANYLSGTLSLLLNQGAGVLGTPTTITGTAQATGLVAQDFDRDGDIDLAVGGNGRLDLLLNDGAGGFPFADRKTRVMPTQVGPLVAADINRDGILDLVAGAEQSSSNPVAVTLGVGDGTFGASTAYTGTSDTTRVPGIVVGDYNRDGGPDLAFVQPVGASPFTQLSVRLSQLLESPTITSTNRTTFTVGSTGAFTLTTTAIPTVTGWTSAGTLPGGVTFVTYTNGTATLGGTPAVGSGGRYALVFTATNGVPPDAVQPFTLTVQEVPSITSANGVTFTLQQFGAFTVTTRGYPTPTVTLSGSLPSGVSYNAATRVISGTPGTAVLGTYPVTLTATNGLAPTATQAFTLTVSGPLLTVAKEVTPDLDVPINRVVTYTIVISNQGSAADPAVLLTDTLPSGATFARWIEQPAGAQSDSNRVTWSGAIAAGSTLTFTFHVTNTVEGGATITNTAQYAGMVQTGTVTRTFTTENACHVTSSGTWSTAFAGCTNPTAKRIIPAGFTITLDADTNLEGDLEVQGSLVANGKTMTLTGTLPQTLTGSPLTFYNLAIAKTNKSDTVSIAGKLKVTKKLTITKGSLRSASEYGDLEIASEGVLTLTNPITITGSFTNAGEFVADGNRVTFDGATVHYLDAQVVTTFDDLVVNAGATLVEVNPVDQVVVNGTLTNAGTIRKIQAVAAAAPYSFGLAGHYADADLDITVATQGSLSSLQVDRIDATPPDLPPNRSTNIYWAISATGAGFAADLALPHDGVAEATACRRTNGSTWNCARSAFDTTTVTRTGVTAFSDWAVFAQEPTTTTLAATPNPSVFGQAVSFTATVVPVAAAGNVQFYFDGTAMGSAQPLLGGTAAMTSVLLAVGTHAITATTTITGGAYTGNEATLAGGLVVNMATAVVTVTSAPNPSAFRQQATVTATVSAVAPGGGIPTGVVTITMGAVSLAANVDGTGVVSITNSSLAVGSYPIDAQYSGDAGFLPAAAAPYTHTIAKAGTTTALDLGPNPAMYGTSVHYTATVSAASADPYLSALIVTGPTGSVRFTDATGTVNLTGTLANGVAIVAGDLIPAGSYTVTATYQGNSSYATSTSPAVVLVVAKYATVTSLGRSASPIFVDDTLVFTVEVSEQLAGNISILAPTGPTGDVHIADSSGAISLTSALANGRVVVDAPWLPEGIYTVTASYDGDARYQASGSDALAQVVRRHATTTTVVLAPVFVYVGDPVTLTATVALSDNDPTVQGGTSVTGTVDFVANGVPLGSATLVDGVAARSGPAPYSGIFTITASYLGNQRYAPSDAGGILLTVVKRSTQTTLAAVPNPAKVGESVVFSATVAEQVIDGVVTALGYAPPAPSGEVIFAEDGTELGRGAVVAGTAVFTTATLPEGDHDITAQYVGDDAFLGSTSAVYIQVVQPVPTAVNDAAGTLQGNAVTVAVLANDLDPAGAGLEIISLIQPAHGSAEIDRVNQTVVYTPDLAFSGVDSFIYTAEDANGNSDDATVAIVVTPRSESGTEPEVAPIDPAQPAQAIFTDTHTGITLDTPAGIYTGTLGEKDIFYLVYTPIITPTGDVGQEPGGFKFGNFVFDLDAYVNDQHLADFHFGQPVTLTIAYDPLLLGGLVESTLTVHYWTGTTWAPDGITVLSRDTTNHTVTIRLEHLSELAFFASAPTALDPGDEPGFTAHLFLPTVAQAGVAPSAGAVAQEEMADRVYLPVVGR